MKREQLKQSQSRREWEEYLWNELLRQILEIHSNPALNKFLSAILSQCERQMIVRRLNILLMLREGKTYREIGRRLWVSPSTIRAVRKSMDEERGYITRWDTLTKQRELKRSLISQKKTFPTGNSHLEMFLDAILNGKSDMRARYRFLKK